MKVHNRATLSGCCLGQTGCVKIPARPSIPVRPPRAPGPPVSAGPDPASESATEQMVDYLAAHPVGPRLNSHRPEAVKLGGASLPLGHVERFAWLVHASRTGLNYSGLVCPGLALGLTAAYLGAELSLGGIDWREPDPLRATAGFSQALVAVSSVVGWLMPSTAAVTTGLMAAGTMTRQWALAEEERWL